MIFKERERTREIRRLYWAKAAIFFFWVLLVFALISLFLSIHNEKSNSSISRRNLTIKPRPTLPQREHSFRKTLFHASPSSSTTTTTQARFVSTNNGGQNNTLYGDDKRIIHTGPNPLHN
ncbi:unnamed protein product [Lupinus luteus]|uniref:Uncharacterized protein n=1 Tax=Lupinus luteus TaxID=3873 RepID=A0AAV1YBS1_LUPLU